MDFTFSEQHTRFRAEVRAFCEAEVTPELFAEMGRLSGEGGHPGFYRKLAEKGYIGMQWPREYGGRGLDNICLTIFNEETEYRFAPVGRIKGSVVFVGQSIIAFGSEEQKRHFLPRIARGEMTCAWCLTEPDSGSDAASLRLRAEKDGGDWVLNGQKIFTSGAHEADTLMVAARTDPDARTKYHGISLFLVPRLSPGLTIRPLHTAGGWHVNHEFFDDVRVPAWLLLGEENKGWQSIAKYTLNFERAGIARTGMLLRLGDELARLVRASKGRAARQLEHQLAEIRAEIVAARWLGYRVAWLYDQGQIPTAESSMIKVLTSDLLARVADLGTEILGLAGLQRGGEAPLEGRIEFFLRSIWFHLVGGGTPDIQRNIIAQWGLGLPREGRDG